MKSLLKPLLLSAVLFVVACGPLKYELKGAVLANGADAELLADVKKEQNLTTVTFTAVNLPPPGRVKEGATTFVVWQRKNTDAPWTRIGALVYDEGGRKGELKDVSVPETSFDLEVTAEIDSAGASPGDAIVFSQRVNG